MYVQRALLNHTLSHIGTDLLSGSESITTWPITGGYQLLQQDCNLKLPAGEGSNFPCEGGRVNWRTVAGMGICAGIRDQGLDLLLDLL